MQTVRGRLQREGIYVQIQLIHTVVWQKLTQYCKAIILQFLRKLIGLYKLFLLQMISLTLFVFLHKALRVSPYYV